MNQLEQPHLQYGGGHLREAREVAEFAATEYTSALAQALQSGRQWPFGEEVSTYKLSPEQFKQFRYARALVEVLKPTSDEMYGRQPEVGLTDQDKLIVSGFIKGTKRQEILQELSVSLTYYKRRLGTVMHKTGAVSLSHLVRLTYQSGEVDRGLADKNNLKAALEVSEERAAYLNLLSLGYGPDEITALLNDKVVKSRLNKLMLALGVNTRPQAVYVGLEAGLIIPFENNQPTASKNDM